MLCSFSLRPLNWFKTLLPKISCDDSSFDTQFIKLKAHLLGEWKLGMSLFWCEEMLTLMMGITPCLVKNCGNLGTDTLTTWSNLQRHPVWPDLSKFWHSLQKVKKSQLSIQTTLAYSLSGWSPWLQWQLIRSQRQNQTGWSGVITHDQCDQKKFAKCLQKWPKNGFTRKMLDFDTFTKIAKECGSFGQINCCQRL